MLYKVFIDDSGGKDYRTPYARSFINQPPTFDGNEEFWRNNYFVLCGARIKDSDIAALNAEINSIKMEYFGTHNVEIKSVWLRNPDKRKKHYLAPFSIAEDDLNAFGNAILHFISAHKRELKLIGVVFDKRYYGDAKRATGHGSPLLKTTQVLLERFHYMGGYHVVVFDQMESSLLLNDGQQGRMLNVFQNREAMGEIFVNQYSGVTDFKFLKSSGENFLQIADVCAYNIYRQFVEHGREWCGSSKDQQGVPALSCYEHFDSIRCNLVAHPRDGRIRGIGLTCIPDTDKLNWDLHRGCEEI